jgi:hypothetical protein
MERRNRWKWVIYCSIILLAILVITNENFWTGFWEGYNNVYQNNQQKVENQAIGQQVEKSQQTQSVNQTQSEVLQSKTKTKSEIIAEWAPRIAYVYCEWDHSNGIFAFAKQGSGTLAKSDGGFYGVTTNKHVIYDENSGTFPNFCQIYFPNNPNIITVYDTSYMVYDKNGNDAGVIVVNDPDDYIIRNAIPLTSCYKHYPQDIVLGQDILFLGYPAIGSLYSQLTLKATQGIISGFDGNYYLTDAKIEEGNSGGMAILLKDNCYLGITTYKIYGPSYEYLSGVLNPAFLSL